MIDQLFLHCPGIGPKSEKQLKESGFKTWDDCLKDSTELPFSGKKRDALLQTLQESKEAYQSHDLEYLIDTFPTREHWRLLAEYHKEATWFDIETSGLSAYDSEVTVISAYRNGRVQSFVYEENLDDFLTLVDDSNLLISFNGNSFDVPFLVQFYNLPDIGCPHIDLRWIAYHQGLDGGLKSIERQLGVQRPGNLSDIDGFEAVRLFHRWQRRGDLRARNKLVQYCEADAIATYRVTQEIVKRL